MKIKEVIVVEGKEDTRRLKEIFSDIDTIETRGSAVDNRTLELIKEAQKKRGVIVFTDPDHQGQRIRSIVNQYVPGCKNAYIAKEKAICAEKHKVGVEHCTKEDIIESLSSITKGEEEHTDIELIDLYHLGILGNEDSQDLRDYISEKLHLGYNNGKQFYNKMKMFNISRNTLNNIIDEFKKGKNNGK